eukprot:TRINITY_DN15116_c0_g1_i2.p1 TRINITY_DN15116_c0_g1~~TRINITY_DN15116_c0_g1_i2.p1  ORF type:complete len:269 (-),score=48.73 TRINITY_DN15116_c0_g1_i2:5-811(-)
MRASRKRAASPKPVAEESAPSPPPEPAAIEGTEGQSVEPSRKRQKTRGGFTESELKVLCNFVKLNGFGAWGKLIQLRLLPGRNLADIVRTSQKLLRQQSLAPYSGLRVDMQKIGVDNADLIQKIRTDPHAGEKLGFIVKNNMLVNSMGQLSKEEKDKKKNEAREKYALKDHEVAALWEDTSFLDDLFRAKEQALAGAQHTLRQALSEERLVERHFMEWQDADVQEFYQEVKPMSEAQLRSLMKDVQAELRSTVQNYARESDIPPSPPR